MGMNRRQFVQRTATAAAAISLPMFSRGRVLGENDEIRMAVIGCVVRGGAHVDAFGGQPGVRIAAVCDPDRERLEEFTKRLNQRGNRPEQVVDVRLLMDLKEFDAVSWPPCNIGTRCPRSGPARRAGTSMSRNRWPTISGRAGRWSTQPASTIGWSRSTPQARSRIGPRDDRLLPLRTAWQDPVHRLFRQQGAFADRQTDRTVADTRDAGL